MIDMPTHLNGYPVLRCTLDLEPRHGYLPHGIFLVRRDDSYGVPDEYIVWGGAWSDGRWRAYVADYVYIDYDRSGTVELDMNVVERARRDAYVEARTRYDTRAARL